MEFEHDMHHRRQLKSKVASLYPCHGRHDSLALWCYRIVAPLYEGILLISIWPKLTTPHERKVRTWLDQIVGNHTQQHQGFTAGVIVV